MSDQLEDSTKPLSETNSTPVPSGTSKSSTPQPDPKITVSDVRNTFVVGVVIITN